MNNFNGPFCENFLFQLKKGKKKRSRSNDFGSDEYSYSILYSDLRVSEYSDTRSSPSCGPLARHIYPSLILVQPRKTRPYLTERLLMGLKESNQTKQKDILWFTRRIQFYLLFCSCRHIRYRNFLNLTA